MSDIDLASLAILASVIKLGCMAVLIRLYR
jgi:hypothetical protein